MSASWLNLNVAANLPPDEPKPTRAERKLALQLMREWKLVHPKLADCRARLVAVQRILISREAAVRPQ